MDVRWICTLTILSTMLVGCSESGNYVLYSSLDRLPDKPSPAKDWIPVPATPQQNTGDTETVAATEEQSGTSKSETKTPGEPDPARIEDDAKRSDGSDVATDGSTESATAGVAATAADAAAALAAVDFPVRSMCTLAEPRRSSSLGTRAPWIAAP